MNILIGTCYLNKEQTVLLCKHRANNNLKHSDIMYENIAEIYASDKSDKEKEALLLEKVWENKHKVIYSK